MNNPWESVAAWSEPDYLLIDPLKWAWHGRSYLLELFHSELQSRQVRLSMDR
jgi:hypothetical protein